MESSEISEVVSKQRAYFHSGATLPLRFRHEALRKLRSAIKGHESSIMLALESDLGKSRTESFLCEIGMTLSELSFIEKHMDRWSRPRRVLTPLAHFHSSSYTVRNPYGVALIMSPWNYPFMLTIEPLIGALASGNCCVLKPSAYSPATSSALRRLISEIYPPEYVAVVEGGRSENRSLLEQEFDYLFFTGGATVGKEVMRRASERLTPISLELGGKSPCVVDATSKLKLAAKRIAFGKLLNAGQTCVAPDYLLVERRVESEFVELLSEQFALMVGPEPLKNPDYVHIVNARHFDRVKNLIDLSKTTSGGGSDPSTLRIEPTIMQGVSAEDPVMQEEIFGPILPVLPYDSIDEAIDFIRSRPHPLACYLFSQNRSVQRRFLREVPFGGGCINDTIVHLATSRMGFGGVGASGMGSYHGYKSFETFSHEKSILHKRVWLDLPVRYMPYNSFQEKLLRFFLR